MGNSVKNTISLGVLLSILAGGAYSQSIYVSASISDDDAVGTRLAYRVKEGIRQSAAMVLVGDEKSSLIQLYLATLNVDGNGQRTAYSVTWTVVNPSNIAGSKFYVTGGVRTCGSSSVDACAERLVAEADQHASFYGPVVRELFQMNGTLPRH
jgi:hypothetical protein